MRPLTLTGPLTDLAHECGWPLDAVTRLYHQVGGMFDFDLLRAAAGSRTAGDAYERMAVRRLVEDMLSEQAAVTRAIVRFAGKAEAGETTARAKAAVNAWLTMRGDAARAPRRQIDEIGRSTGGWTFAKLTIANGALREIAELG